MERVEVREVEGVEEDSDEEASEKGSEEGNETVTEGEEGLTGAEEKTEKDRDEDGDLLRGLGNSREGVTSGVSLPEGGSRPESSDFSSFLR